MASNHFVSIITPSYNRAHYIVEAIESVIHQTWSNWELIIVDDGSTDNTEAVVRPYLSHQIKYYQLEHTGRIGQVRNFGMTHSTGNLIAYLDSDDLWRPDRLEFQINLMNKFPDAAFIIGNGDEFGEGMIQTPDYTPPLFFGKLFLPILEQSEFCLYTSTFLFKRTVLDKIGLLQEIKSILTEVYFFYKMSYEFDGLFSNERLIKIRKHSLNTSKEDEAGAYVDTLPMLDYFFTNKMINKRQLHYLKGLAYYQMGLVYLRKNDGFNSFKIFFQYNLVYPIQYKGYARLAHACFIFVKSYF